MSSVAVDVLHDCSDAGNQEKCEESGCHIDPLPHTSLLFHSPIIAQVQKFYYPMYVFTLTGHSLSSAATCLMDEPPTLLFGRLVKEWLSCLTPRRFNPWHRKKLSLADFISCVFYYTQWFCGSVVERNSWHCTASNMVP